jgi:uncharacterized membrane protein YeaQ/YmgE (transglycosylase-associated protein family)
MIDMHSMTAVTALFVYGALIGWVMSLILKERLWTGIVLDIIVGVIGVMIGSLLAPILDMSTIGMWILSGSFAVNFIFIINFICYENLNDIAAAEPRTTPDT